METTRHDGGPELVEPRLMSAEARALSITLTPSGIMIGAPWTFAKLVRGLVISAVVGWSLAAGIVWFVLAWGKGPLHEPVLWLMGAVLFLICVSVPLWVLKEYRKAKADGPVMAADTTRGVYRFPEAGLELDEDSFGGLDLVRGRFLKKHPSGEKTLTTVLQLSVRVVERGGERDVVLWHGGVLGSRGWVERVSRAIGRPIREHDRTADEPMRVDAW